ncbi:MAG: acetate--CoA ligase family protein [Anaerolineae bacterium]|nr:acetate--CoA ligase family protein [Anaerolineae bacterium]
MKVLEYEAKYLLKQAGLPVPAGQVAATPDAAAAAAQAVDAPFVMKVQIPAGGRMKAGGVKFGDSPQAAQNLAEALLHTEMRGFSVEKVLVEKRLDIAAEVFIAVTYDDFAKTAMLLLSVEGGIEVESANEVIRYPFSLSSRFPDFKGRELAATLGFVGESNPPLGRLITRLANTFARFDALLLECNPCVLTTDGKWWVADVHLELDDDAGFRQKALLEAIPDSVGIANHRSDFEQRAMEIDSADHRGVAGRLIPFDGNVGMLIGGGGASLTVMDAALDQGLKPANYCEIGGNPSVWKIKELTKLILSQPQVDKLVVTMNVVSNTRADLVARGVIKGVLEMGQVPGEVIAAFRIPGSWEDESRAILSHYGIRYFGRETSLDQTIESLQ